MREDEGVAILKASFERAGLHPAADVPIDDESYTVECRLKNDAWVKKR